MQGSVIVGSIKSLYSLQIVLIVVFCQKVFFFFHLLQYPGIDPFPVVEIVLIVVQITDYLKIIGKGIQPDIGILMEIRSISNCQPSFPVLFRKSQ